MSVCTSVSFISYDEITSSTHINQAYWLTIVIQERNTWRTPPLNAVFIHKFWGETLGKTRRLFFFDRSASMVWGCEKSWITTIPELTLNLTTIPTFCLFRRSQPLRVDLKLNGSFFFFCLNPIHTWNACYILVLLTNVLRQSFWAIIPISYDVEFSTDLFGKSSRLSIPRKPVTWWRNLDTWEIYYNIIAKVNQFFLTTPKKIEVSVNGRGLLWSLNSCVSYDNICRKVFDSTYWWA